MLRIRNLLLLQRRLKSSKKHWSVLQRKRNNTDRALECFDDFYGSVFGLRWKNMRAALLCEHKYVAMVNIFGDTEKTCSKLELDGAINIKSLVYLAKERLEAQEPQFNKINNFKLDNEIQEFTRKQQEREISSIYPEGADINKPTHIKLGEDDSDEQTLNADSGDSSESGSEGVESGSNTNTFDPIIHYTVDHKKSLEQAFEEDLDIDIHRLVDPNYATGALYDFLPATKIKGMEDWIPESTYYKYYQTNTDFPLRYELETNFNFPENLCLYTYELGNCAEFQTPKKCITGVLSHFLMDGASILPPLFLDVKYGERVLDACAAPGGKSLLILQTLHPMQLVCNDVQESRVNRIRKVMRDYVFDYKERWEGKQLVLSECDARNLRDYDRYDKILVDVPCTTDRHSLMENDNNIFKPTRIRERLRLPELQAGILTNCLRLLKPGGSLVYSTCSLSPVQNDGVIHMALQKAFNEFGITTTIKDLSLLIELFGDIYKFENPKGLRYGQMVLPHLPANFGPMYFSKITRDA